MNRTEIANRILKAIDGSTYLEIGVQRGKNFFDVKANKKIAVDPEFKIGLTRKLKYASQLFTNRFFEKTSDDFFAQDAPAVFKNRLIDVALIDGLHTYEQSLKDFKNCFRYLSPNGVILFHDCNPSSAEAAAFAYSPEDMQAKFPGKNPEWNGDVYKTIVHLQALEPDLHVFVFDCDYGVGVVRRGKPEARLELTASQVGALTYDDLDKNRKRFLNIKSPEFLSEFIQQL